MRQAMIMLTVLIAAAAMIAAFSSPATAAVSGPCVDCHTMHNSQGGSAMATFGGETGPNATLLRGSCLGCHAQNTGDNMPNGIPQVKSTDTDLAGGDFTYLGTDDNRGHNVDGLGTEDTDLGSDPPAYSNLYDPASTDYSSTSRLTCAGQQGCHGNRDVLSQYTAVSGAHHSNDDCLKFGTINEASQGLSVATSYRFLYKVKGGEASDWQDAVTPTNHNEYKGAVYSASRTSMAWGDVDTISELCAECHGNFHADGGVQDTNNDWVRHPSDALIENTGEYASISATYNPVTPVGRTTIPNNMTTGVAAGVDIVMCLSCHRAHASNYADILRWEYSDMVAGTTGAAAGTGCFVCHTGKDG